MEQLELEQVSKWDAGAADTASVAMLPCCLPDISFLIALLKTTQPA